MVITKTRAQAEIRARGIWKDRAWCESLKPAIIKWHARQELTEWLDGLTLLVRSLDLLLIAPGEKDDDVSATKLVRRLLRGSPYRYPFRCGTKTLGAWPIRTVIGHGWSWDEAFAMAEEKLAAKESA